MRLDTFEAGIDRIYTIFGMSRKPSKDMQLVWYTRLDHIPDEAVNFIVEQICDLESMPRNMTVAWKNYWSNWKTANPSKIVRQDCQLCRNTGARDCWARPEDGGPWVHFMTPCPACQSNDTRMPMPLAELEAKGAIIMPVGYRGGPVGFDRDNGFGCLHHVSLDTSTPRKTMHVGVNMKQDFKRVRHLPAGEREEYGQSASW